MALPIILFALTGVVCGGLFLKSQSRLWQIREQLKMHMPNLRRFELLAALKMGKGIDGIFDQSDTESVRELKYAYIKELEIARASHWKIVKIFLIGFSISSIVGILEAIMSGKP